MPDSDLLLLYPQTKLCFLYLVIENSGFFHLGGLSFKSNAGNSELHPFHSHTFPFSATTSMVTLKIKINLKIYNVARCELLQQRTLLFTLGIEHFFSSNVHNIKLN